MGNGLGKGVTDVGSDTIVCGCRHLDSYRMVGTWARGKVRQAGQGYE